jgi:phage baseplate assembly protein gpV
MLQSERVNSFEESLRLALKGQSLMTWNCLPAIIQSFDAEKCTCTAQVAIQAYVRQQNGNQQYVNMPLLVDVPVVFPNAGNFVLTFPVTSGDECLVLFADRCIDNWWNEGGIQPQVTNQGVGELRFHDLSDGFAIIGPFSKPNVPSGISTSTVQLRTKDGATYLEIDSANNCNIHANVHITGNLTISGNTTGTGSGLFGGIHVEAHRHTGVQTGGGTTGEPIDG